MTVTAKKIKQIRLALGESQDKFGQRFDVNQSTVHRWETYGIPPRGITALAIQMILRDIETGKAA